MTVQITDITERPVLLLGWSLDLTVDPTGIASSATVGTAQANASVAVSGVASAAAVGTAQVDASVLASGVAATGAVGTPTLQIQTNTLEPAAIASTVAFGAAKTVAAAPVDGVAASGSNGTPSAFNTINPTGISAPGAAGTPRLNFVMNPTGVGSGEAFGDADTVATAFIIPGPVDPSNDFGNAVVTKKGWIFRPPVSTYQWRLFKEYEGISLLKENGTWTEVAHPDLERTRNADKYLGGGRDHVVSTSLKAELEGLGYTVTEEIVTTEEYLS